MGCRDCPQRQREDEDEVSQGQVDNKRIHQTPTSLFAAHHQDDKEVAEKAGEEDEVIQNWQKDVGALEM